MAGLVDDVSTAGRRLVRAGVAAAALLALAGCTSNPVQPPATTSPDPSVSAPTVAPSTSATPTPEPVGFPVGKTCDELLPPDAVYAFNPNLGVDPAYAVVDGSPAAEMVDLEGVSCGLLNQTSGETIEVTVALLTPDAIEARKNALVSSSQQVPTFGAVTDEGYFSVLDTVGRANAFVGDYWIETSSTVYYEPGDAQPIVEAVAAALG